MTRRAFHLTPLAAALLALSATSPTPAQERRVDHPRLRAALHELREARAALNDAKDSWPPGYKDRALASIDDAIKSVRTILDVKDVNTFVGVDRNPDYYKKYKDHPRLRAALDDLRDARDELKSAKADFRGQKERALDDIEVAIGDILTLIRDRR